MPTYTAVFTRNMFSQGIAEIEADSYDEAMSMAQAIQSNEDVDGEVPWDDWEFEGVCFESMKETRPLP